MVKRGGAYLFFIFVSKKRGVLERDLKERGAKYRNYSTSIPSSPFPNMMLQERGQLQGLMYCMLCTW